MSVPGSHDLTSTQASMSEEIHLQTPMNIVPEGGSVRRISSSTPFYVNGIEFWSATPIHIFGSGKERLIIKPSTDLGLEFARRWFELPNELKIKVLESMLIENGAIYWHSSFPGSGNRRINSSVYPELLRSTPVIAALARTTYYSNNTFLVDLSPFAYLNDNAATSNPNRHHGPFFAYPKLANNSLIRSLEFHCCIGYVSLPLFRRFADGSCGFQNLRRMQLILTGGDGFVPQDGWDEPFRFGCEGSIRCPKRLWYRAKRSEEDDDFDLVERLKPWSIFGCSKAKRDVVAEPEM